MSREFYQGIVIEIRRENKKWRVVVDGEKDALCDTKAEATRYVDMGIKVSE
jgi:secreted PhoX family phosphatase